MLKLKGYSKLTNYLSFPLIFAIWIIFTVLTRGLYLSPRNISFIILQTAEISCLSMGMAFVIISGNIDLSVGSVLGATGALAALLQVRILPFFFGSTGHDLFITISTLLIVLLFGALIGLWQGLWISYGKVPSFIVTMSGMFIFRGTSLFITKGITLRPMFQNFKFLGQAYVHKTVGIFICIIIILLLWLNWIIKNKREKILNLPKKKIFLEFLKYVSIAIMIVILTIIINLYKGFPIPVIIVIALALILSFISKNTKFGRYTYASGGNAESSTLVGINIKLNTLLIFILIGVLSSISGIIFTARLDAGTTYAGEFYELSAIAACVIGGVSLFGGKGSIIGAVIGSIILSSIENGLMMLNIEIPWQYMIKGLIIVIFVWIDINFRTKS
jgi:D-xylose transport system permease protein